MKSKAEDCGDNGHVVVHESAANDGVRHVCKCGFKSFYGSVTDGSCPDCDIMMTSSEVAVMLKIQLKTVYKLAENGVIPGEQIGRSWRFRRSKVMELIATR